MSVVDGPLVTLLDEITELSQVPVGATGNPPDVTLLTDCANISPPGSPKRITKESTPLLGRCDQEVNTVYNYFPEDQDYANLFSQVDQAIEHGINPERISQGSSGSYFVKNLDGVRIFSLVLISAGN